MNAFYLDGELIQYKVHPLALIDRQYTDKEMSSLVESIEKVGLLNAVHIAIEDEITYLLDGRHRLKALSIIEDDAPVLTTDKVVFADIDINDYYEVDDYVLANNSERRHNTLEQRNAALLLKKEVFSKWNDKQIKEAAQRGNVTRWKDREGDSQSAAPMLAQPRDRTNNTVHQLAKWDGRSTGTIKKIIAVDKKGSDEVKAKMNTGEISTNLAFEVVKAIPKEKQAEVVKQDQKLIREAVKAVKEEMKKKNEERAKRKEEIEKGNRLFLEKLKEDHGDGDKVTKIRSMVVNIEFHSELPGLGTASIEIKGDDNIRQFLDVLEATNSEQGLDFSQVKANK